MTISTGVFLKGIVDVDVRRRDDGTLVEQRLLYNLIVHSGLDMLSRLLVSPFINQASDNVTIRPLQAIGVGTNPNNPDGTVVPVTLDQATLDQEWTRKRIESVEILRASLDVRANGTTTKILELSSRIQGAYGNRVSVKITSANTPYGIEITDRNTPYWNGSAWMQGTAAVRTHTGSTISELLSKIDTDPAVRAHAPDLNWTGTLESFTSKNLSGGGGGVIVSATFTNPDAQVRAITEAALFTTEDRNDPTSRMFNMVRFPVINVTSSLDVTFRWKLLFQEQS